MKGNLVTVCVATYNRAKNLRGVVSNISNQTYSNIEIIIVDDCSEDETYRVCSTLQQEFGIIYFRHSRNLGLAAARNTAIKHASGRYFSFIDDDDAWSSDFLEKFVQLASQYDERWCFCCGVSNTKYGKVRQYIPRLEGALSMYFRQGYTPPVAGQFYYVSTLRNVGGYNVNVKTGVDHDLWLKLALDGVKLKSLEEALSLPNGTLTDANRMTTNPQKRLTRLDDTLTIWKESIDYMYGNEFFPKFKRAYVVREKNAFISKILNSQGLYAAVIFFAENHKDLSFLVFSKQVLLFGLSLLKVDGFFYRSRVIDYPPVLNVKG